METKKNNTKKPVLSKVIKRNESITRQDIADWKSALSEAGRIERPKQNRLQRLYEDITRDALLSSQMAFRIDKTQGADFTLADIDGKDDPKAAAALKDSGLFDSLVELILEAKFYGCSLVELDYDRRGAIRPMLVPRRNVSPEDGLFYPDIYGDGCIDYRSLPDFGRRLLEFNCNRTADYGILNRAIPHVLMKKFAQSCWSELCEIYGIPPRVMKTDTTSPDMLQRAENMMKTIGSAAWFIIDTTEDFNFANSVSTNGDVYNNLIQLCNNEISMLTLGAVIGQDTVNGNRSKEESAQKLTDSIVLADRRFVEFQFNGVILPALASLGFIPEGLRLSIQEETDIAELWNITYQAAQFFDIDPAWVKSKFGVEVTGSRLMAADANPNMSAENPIDFFV